MRAWANVAELAKPKNLTGGLVARSAPGLPFLLHEGLEVAFVPPQIDAPRRARVTSVQEAAKGTFLVTFEGVDSIDVAERLAGCCCLVRRSDLPEDVLVAPTGGLEGFEVYDAQTGLVGRVTDVIESPAQMLLSIERPEGGDPVLVPLVDAFIEGVDEDARRIDMNLPEGLLDL